MPQDARGMVAGPQSPSHREYAHLLPGMGSRKWSAHPHTHTKQELYNKISA